jgi:aryl-alcohol dehydrogenase-like predicted oxidoreductase
LGGGALTGKYLKGESGRVVAHSARRSDRANNIAARVVEIADSLGVPPAQVAINWTRQRDSNSNIIPLIGARTAVQLEDSLGCLHFSLPEEVLRSLDEASAIEMGFPHDFLATANVRELVYSGAYDKIKH